MFHLHKTIRGLIMKFNIEKGQLWKHFVRISNRTSSAFPGMAYDAEAYAQFKILSSSRLTVIIWNIFSIVPLVCSVIPLQHWFCNCSNRFVSTNERQGQWNIENSKRHTWKTCELQSGVCPFTLVIIGFALFDAIMTFTNSQGSWVNFRTFNQPPAGRQCIKLKGCALPVWSHLYSLEWTFSQTTNMSVVHDGRVAMFIYIELKLSPWLMIFCLRSIWRVRGEGAATLGQQ
jgi:hypothetical protein